MKARRPTKQTNFGLAWKIDLEAAREHYCAKVGKATAADATVSAWVVFCPWAHPWWSSYAVFAVHLRPCEGMPRPSTNMVGATHEAIVFALDPAREPDLLDPLATRLEPANFAGQWIVQQRNPVDADREAADKIEKCVDEILAGELSPDTDFANLWIERFSNSNVR